MKDRAPASAATRHCLNKELMRLAGSRISLGRQMRPDATRPRDRGAYCHFGGHLSEGTDVWEQMGGDDVLCISLGEQARGASSSESAPGAQRVDLCEFLAASLCIPAFAFSRAARRCSVESRGGEEEQEGEMQRARGRG